MPSEGGSLSGAGRPGDIAQASSTATGNMSSATIMFVLKEMLSAGRGQGCAHGVRAGPDGRDDAVPGGGIKAGCQ